MVKSNQKRKVPPFVWHSIIGVGTDLLDLINMQWTVLYMYIYYSTIVLCCEALL